MTGHRLCLIDLPSVEGSAWRTALASKASSLGWMYLELWGDPAPELEPENHYFIVSLGPDTIRSIQPSSLMVLWGGVGGVLTALQSHGEHAVWIAANRLAMGTELALAGAVVLDARNDWLELPYFGVVHRDMVAPVALSTNNTLGFYDDLPPTPGITVRWLADILVRPDGQDPCEPIDLTGRRRIVAHGPPLELPAGVWRATLHLRLRAPASSMTLRFEWGPGSDVSYVELSEQRSGFFSITLEATWLEPVPARLIIWAQIPMFDGEVMIEGADIELVSRSIPVTVSV